MAENFKIGAKMNSNNETEPVEKDEGNSMVVDKASDQKGETFFN